MLLPGVALLPALPGPLRAALLPGVRVASRAPWRLARAALRFPRFQRGHRYASRVHRASYPSPWARRRSRRRPAVTGTLRGSWRTPAHPRRAQLRDVSC